MNTKTLALVGVRPGSFSPDIYADSYCQLYVDYTKTLINGFLSKNFLRFVSTGDVGFGQLSFWAVESAKRSHPELDIRNELYLTSHDFSASLPDSGAFSVANFKKMAALADNVHYASDFENSESSKIRDSLLVADCDAMLSFCPPRGLSFAMASAIQNRKPLYRFWADGELHFAKRGDDSILERCLSHDISSLTVSAPQRTGVLPDNSKFLIIDGSSLLCTRFYGSVPPEFMRVSTSEEEKASILASLPRGDVYYGNPAVSHHIACNAIDGFLDAVVHCLMDFSPTHVAVCFDADSSATFRKSLYPKYKAQRGEKPAELKEQIVAIQEVCRRLGIPVFMSPEYEADDFAGSLAKKAESLGAEVFLLTSDKDYLQLVSDRTTVWMLRSPSQIEALASRHGESAACPSFAYAFTPRIVKEALGVDPGCVAAWKALAGDPSDNIPGIKGVGDTSAAKALSYAGSLEKAVELCAELPITQKYKDLISSEAETARFFLKLTEIKTDIPVSVSSCVEKFDWSILDEVVKSGRLAHTGRLLETRESLLEEESLVR